MKMKALQKETDTIAWPKSSNDLPVLSWDQCQFISSLLISSILTFHYSPRIIKNSKVNCRFWIHPRWWAIYWGTSWRKGSYQVSSWTRRHYCFLWRSLWSLQWSRKFISFITSWMYWGWLWVYFLPSVRFNHWLDSFRRDWNSQSLLWSRSFFIRFWSWRSCWKVWRYWWKGQAKGDHQGRSSSCWITFGDTRSFAWLRILDFIIGLFSFFTVF